VTIGVCIARLILIFAILLKTVVIEAEIIWRLGILASKRLFRALIILFFGVRIIELCKSSRVKS
jgi:hypothetical protein